MKKLDQFVLKSFVGPFVAILLIVVFILMMQFLWVYIDELVGKGLGFWVIMEFMMWGACTIMPMALPLAVLLSSMMVIGQMGENKELMAIKAAGISTGRLLAPLAITAALVSVGAFFIGNNLVPKAYNEIFTLRDDITRTKDEIKIPPGTFYDGIEGYILRVEGQDKETGMMYQVKVYDHTKRRGNTSLIIADSAMLKISKNKDYLTFSLYSGTNYEETNEMNYRDTSLAFSRIDFKREELIIPLKNYSFEHSDSSRFGDQAKSMRLDQLKHQKDSLEDKNLAAFEAHYRRFRGEVAFARREQRLRPLREHHPRHCRFVCLRLMSGEILRQEHFLGGVGLRIQISGYQFLSEILVCQGIHYSSFFNCSSIFLRAAEMVDFTLVFGFPVTPAISSSDSPSAFLSSRQVRSVSVRPASIRCRISRQSDRSVAAVAGAPPS